MFRPIRVGAIYRWGVFATAHCKPEIKLDKEAEKASFQEALTSFVADLGGAVQAQDGQWAVKGFIDAYRNIYAISADTKVVSKILEIHLFPKLLLFAEQNGFGLVLAEHQNYYPDLSFVKQTNPEVKFAVDFKTTYRVAGAPDFCNGFTLGSHGEYFKNRNSTKNIQFPYRDYLSHFCLGIIYSRSADESLNETKTYQLDDLTSIVSVIRDIQFFVQEKWKIASDRRGSGNTANIGSITRIDDIVAGNGMFSALGEDWFDDYWMNYDSITIRDPAGDTRTIRNLIDFVKYRGGDETQVVPRSRRRRGGG